MKIPRKHIHGLGLAGLLLTTCVGAGAGQAAAGQLDRSVLKDPDRPATERQQDEARKSLELYEWLGIGPGMTVADLWPGEGYNAHLLSLLMGEEGKVVAVWDWYGTDVFGADYNHRPGFEERAAHRKPAESHGPDGALPRASTNG